MHRLIGHLILAILWVVLGAFCAVLFVMGYEAGRRRSAIAQPALAPAPRPGGSFTGRRAV